MSDIRVTPAIISHCWRRLDNAPDSPVTEGFPVSGLDQRADFSIGKSQVTRFLPEVNIILWSRVSQRDDLPRRQAENVTGGKENGSDN